MEIFYQNTPSKSRVEAEQPSKEHLAEPGVWSTELFHEHLNSSELVSHSELPREIWLDDNWHNLIHNLTTRTAQDGNEWSVDFVSLDRSVKNTRRISLPLNYKKYYQEPWGDTENPVFFTKPLKGTPHHTHPGKTFPSVIKWEDKPVALQLVGTIHTHPGESAFSVGDMFSITTGETEKFLIAATTEYNFMFLRTADQPILNQDDQEYAEAIAYGYTKEATGQPDWKERLLGIKDNIHRLKRHQAIYELSQEFCKTYKVGLYGGKPGKPLTRLI